jgi:hypothetical protein
VTHYATQTQLLLGAAPFDVPFGGPTTTTVSIANNLITGVGAGVAVEILPNGSPPGYTLQYGAANHYEVTGSWVRIQGNGANVSFDVDDKAVPLTPSIVGTSTSSGGSAVAASVPISGSVTTIYTVPANYRARLVTAAINDGTSGDTSFLAVNRVGLGLYDYLTPPAGKTYPASGDISFGMGPGNTIIIPPDFYLRPGDTLVGYSSPNGATGQFAGLLEPL